MPPNTEHATALFGSKKITLMGLGLLGRGVGDAAYLASCGADLIVTDLKSQKELTPSLEKLSGFSNIRYVLGGHSLSDFRNRDLIIKAAGVSEDSPYLIEARSKSVPIRMSTELFVELSGLPVIGVTGTRGKTTVTYMIHAILKAAGIPALIGGNIPNVSTLALLPHAGKARVAVLELDSWQLQGFGASKRSPHIAVFTTFYQDHLFYYRGDTKRYLADKANIFLYQDKADTFVLGAQATNSLSTQYSHALRRAIVASESDAADLKLRIPGTHNRYNAACARAATLAYGIDEETIRHALEAFPGVSGRLELVRTKDNIRVYNDTTAVTPEATCAGLQAFAGLPITLIMGGKDKRNDISSLVRTIKQNAPQVVLLPGTGSDAIAEHIPSAIRCKSLRHAVQEALLRSPRDGIILFSPAFSSHGEFTDVYDRGEKFLSTLDEIWTR